MRRFTETFGHSEDSRSFDQVYGKNADAIFDGYEIPKRFKNMFEKAVEEKNEMAKRLHEAMEIIGVGATSKQQKSKMDAWRERSKQTMLQSISEEDWKKLFEKAKPKSQGKKLKETRGYDADDLLDDDDDGSDEYWMHHKHDNDSPDEDDPEFQEWLQSMEAEEGLDDDGDGSSYYMSVSGDSDEDNYMPEDFDDWDEDAQDAWLKEHVGDPDEDDDDDDDDWDEEEEEEEEEEDEFAGLPPAGTVYDSETDTFEGYITNEDGTYTPDPNYKPLPESKRSRRARRMKEADVLDDFYENGLDPDGNVRPGTDIDYDTGYHPNVDPDFDALDPETGRMMDDWDDEDDDFDF